MSKENKITYLILGLLLCLAAFLRLYHPFDIPFTADEFDALGRTKFNSFSELISKGVIIDAHPAGVQVFLYYWTKVFGYSELAVKLPFIICGILAVLYIFLIAKEWFNSTAGLVCAVFIATLQYTVMYSQIARPYSSGLFFSLAMVYYWYLFLFKPEKHYYRNLILYILFSALCAYNHHFSLMFAALAGITGLFFIQKKNVWKYAGAGAAIFILYIPHLHIFFYQLHVGGLKGVFGKPQNDYILDYLKFAFNFSKLIYLSIAILLFFGLYMTFKKRLPNGQQGTFWAYRFMIISFSWFLIPFLTGFFYSVLISPVLEYSSLIFSFPFLLFCLFGWLPELNFTYKSITVVSLSFITTISLVHERKYYDIFYQSRYERQVLLTDSVIKSVGINNCIPYLEMSDNDSVPEYYMKIHKINVPYINLKYPDKQQLIRYLEQNAPTHPYLSYGSLARTDPTLVAIFLNYYPYIVKQYNFDEGTFYFLTSKPGIGKPPYIFESVNTFDKAIDYWGEADKALVSSHWSADSTLCYKMDSLHEWAPSFSCPLAQMTKNRNNLILITLSLYPLETLKDVDIVSTLKSGDKEIYWSSSPATDFIADTICRKWVKTYHAIKLPDIYLNYPDIKVNIYIWNRGKRNFNMKDFSVRTIDGNPLIYWMIESL